MLKKQGAEKTVEHNSRTPQPEHLVIVAEEKEEQEWQELIDSIEATDVPLEMLKYLRVHLKDGNKMVFPIIKWEDEGADFKEIKKLVSDWYRINNKKILGSDFIVNLPKLKETVKSQTDKTLKDL